MEEFAITLEIFGGIIGFLIIIVTIGVILIKIDVARETYDIACKKGYDDIKYYWIAFFLSGAGILLVIALPNKKESKDLLDELPEL